MTSLFDLPPPRSPPKSAAPRSPPKSAARRSAARRSAATRSPQLLYYKSRIKKLEKRKEEDRQLIIQIQREYRLHLEQLDGVLKWHQTVNFPKLEKLKEENKELKAENERVRTELASMENKVEILEGENNKTKEKWIIYKKWSKLKEENKELKAENERVSTKLASTTNELLDSWFK
jgi:hypothetical protein